MIEVVEFIARLEQGYTEAFLCRATDGHLYATKSVRAGREALIREVIAGRVGLGLGLPVPPFAMLYASAVVAAQSMDPALSDLTVDVPGFGSRFVDGVPTFNVSDVAGVDAAVRRSVLLFDWWVLNDDRTDDNPNLLWAPGPRSLHMIDHNLAFDADLLAGQTTMAFWQRHIFRQSRAELSDPSYRAEMVPVMDDIIRDVPAWWSSLPDEWTTAAPLNLDAILATLRRCRSAEFWMAGQ